MTPGIYKRMTFGDYRAIPAMNQSALKEASKSLLQYRHRLDHPRESSTPLRLGSAAHTAVLEPHRFLAEYALWDEKTEAGDKVAPRRGKKWEAFLEVNVGKSAVTVEEHEQATAIRDAVRLHPCAGRYLRRGDSEVTMVWVDEETGAECKGRLDWLTTDGGADVLVGLKTSRDCRHIAFGNQAARLGYHVQWAFYADGYQRITGKSARVIEIVVESAAPNDVSVFVIPDEILDVGREEYRRLLKAVREAEAIDEWPGVSLAEQTLSFPTWALQAEDDITGLDLE